MPGERPTRVGLGRKPEGTDFSSAVPWSVAIKR